MPSGGQREVVGGDGQPGLLGCVAGLRQRFRRDVLAFTFDEFEVGDVKALRYFGEDLAAYRDESGELTGYLHLKDALETDDARGRVIADKWVRPLVTVPVGAGLFDALRLMQSRGSHMARVADVEGHVVGVIMLEDVLEELVGEIRDVERA